MSMQEAVSYHPGSVPLPRRVIAWLTVAAGCVGARRVPPFGAHAWVEADGRQVGEDYPPDYFRVFFTVS